MNKYFKIEYKSELVFPQIQTFDKKLSNKVEYLDIPNYGKIEKDLEFVLKLEPNSTKTDLISAVHFGGMCLVVSSKFKSILEEIIFKYYQFMPLKLSFKGKLIEDYFLLHFVKGESFISDLIDYKESIFKIEKLIEGKIG